MMQIFFAEDMGKQGSFYVGTIGAVFPNPQYSMLIGQVHPQSIGWFAEFKGGIGIPKDVEYDSTSTWVEEALGTPIIKEKDIFSTYSAGITYLVNTKTIIYLGIGMTKSINHNQYNDPLGILGDSGELWVEDDVEHKTITSYTAGIFRRMQYNDKLFLIGSLSILSSPFNIGISFGTEW